ncbi:Hypothetical predicted protein [Podarcis lilfordi]|uniref:Uncharacterized protein n=1 Tax=Podarcis lilfordi TaxID=74358 RepID=A0AA35L3N5_9SAUR|nr:Hypothetical predicted protein [Podarcis lilfordi]
MLTHFITYSGAVSKGSNCSRNDCYRPIKVHEETWKVYNIPCDNNSVWQAWNKGFMLVITTTAATLNRTATTLKSKISADLLNCLAEQYLGLGWMIPRLPEGLLLQRD